MEPKVVDRFMFVLWLSFCLLNWRFTVIRFKDCTEYSKGKSSCCSSSHGNTTEFQMLNLADSSCQWESHSNRSKKFQCAKMTQCGLTSPYPDLTSRLDAHSYQMCSTSEVKVTWKVTLTYMVLYKSKLRYEEWRRVLCRACMSSIWSSLLICSILLSTLFSLELSLQIMAFLYTWWDFLSSHNA